MGARVNVVFEPSHEAQDRCLGKFSLHSFDIDGNPITAALNFDFFPLWEFSQ